MVDRVYSLGRDSMLVVLLLLFYSIIAHVCTIMCYTVTVLVTILVLLLNKFDLI